MPISEIWSTVASCGGVAIVIILLGIIKIKPLEISIWNWLFRKIGRAFNGEVLDKVNSLDRRLEEHIDESFEYRIGECRRRILAFDSSLYRAKNNKNKVFYHTEEEFNDILEAIDKYEKYCKEHPDYPNSKCLMAIDHIREVYLQCKEEDSFI